MRIEIYDEKAEPEKVVRLQLVRDGERVLLQTVHRLGARESYILTITMDGIKRVADAEHSGLPTDDKGRVLLVDE